MRASKEKQTRDTPDPFPHPITTHKSTTKIGQNNLRDKPEQPTVEIIFTASRAWREERTQQREHFTTNCNNATNLDPIEFPPLVTTQV